MSTFTTFTKKEWCILLLTSLSSGFTYSITTIGIPILPQYFRDAGIYEVQNVTHGFVCCNQLTQNVTDFQFSIPEMEQHKCTKMKQHSTVFCLQVMQSHRLWLNRFTADSWSHRCLFLAFRFMHVISRFRPLNLMTILMPFLLVTTTLFAFCQSYYGLMTARMMQVDWTYVVRVAWSIKLLFQGIVSGGTNVCALALISATFSGRARVFALEVLNCAWIMLSRLMPAVAGKLYSTRLYDAEQAEFTTIMAKLGRFCWWPL